MAVSSPPKNGVGRKPTTWVQLSRGASTLSPSPQVESIRCEKSSGSPASLVRTIVLELLFVGSAQVRVSSVS